MALDRPLQDGIRAERELLEPLRNWADLVIDTSTFSASQLQQTIRERFSGGPAQPHSFTISRFAFARGMPPLAGLVFDMRFLDHPHRVPHLRALKGLNPPVAAPSPPAQRFKTV